MKRLVIAAFMALALLASSLVPTLGGVARADEPCKVDCAPIAIAPVPNPGEALIGPIIVVPDIVSIIGPQIDLEAGFADPWTPEITRSPDLPPDN